MPSRRMPFEQEHIAELSGLRQACNKMVVWASRTAKSQNPK
ncbi:MAG: hypothetical protein ACLS69_04545 [Butyricicoccus sp.]